MHAAVAAVLHMASLQQWSVACGSAAPLSVQSRVVGCGAPTKVIHLLYITRCEQTTKGT